MLERRFVGQGPEGADYYSITFPSRNVDRLEITVRHGRGWGFDDPNEHVVVRGELHTLTAGVEMAQKWIRDKLLAGFVEQPLCVVTIRNVSINDKSKQFWTVEASGQPWVPGASVVVGTNGIPSNRKAKLGTYKVISLEEKADTLWKVEVRPEQSLTVVQQPTMCTEMQFDDLAGLVYLRLPWSAANAEAYARNKVIDLQAQADGLNIKMGLNWKRAVVVHSHAGGHGELRVTATYLKARLVDVFQYHQGGSMTLRFESPPGWLPGKRLTHTPGGDFWVPGNDDLQQDWVVVGDKGPGIEVETHERRNQRIQDLVDFHVRANTPTAELWDAIGAGWTHDEKQRMIVDVQQQTRERADEQRLRQRIADEREQEYRRRAAEAEERERQREERAVAVTLEVRRRQLRRQSPGTNRPERDISLDED